MNSDVIGLMFDMETNFVGLLGTNQKTQDE